MIRLATFGGTADPDEYDSIEAFVSEWRADLEKLAESDLPAAWVAHALLKAASAEGRR